MDPYQRLAGAVLKQAADDMNSVSKGIELCEQSIERLSAKGDKKQLVIEQNRLAVLNGEYQSLIRFFNDEWCEALCDLAKVDYGAAKGAMLKKGG